MPESCLYAVYSVSASLIFIFLPWTSPNHLNSIPCDDFNIMLCYVMWMVSEWRRRKREREKHTHKQFVRSRNWYTRNCLHLVIFNSIFCGFFCLNRFYTLFWYWPYQHTNTSGGSGDDDGNATNTFWVCQHTIIFKKCSFNFTAVKRTLHRLESLTELIFYGQLLFWLRTE